MKNKIILTSWVVVFSTALLGQTAQTISLKSAVDMALQHSAQVKKAHLERERINAQIRHERSAALPQVVAELNFDVYPLLPTQFIPGEVVGRPDGTFVPVQIGRPWQLTPSVKIEQTLYSESGRRMLGIADDTRAVGDLLAIRTEEEVKHRTATIYYQLLQTRQLLRSVQANTEKLDALQRMAELQLNNGYITPTDLKRLKVARGNLESQRAQLLAGIEALRQTLAMLCGLAYDAPFELADDYADPVADSTRWLVKLGHVDQSIEMRLLALQEDINRATARAARVENLPTLSAYAYGWVQAQRGNEDLFELDRRWFGMGVVGLKARMPLFDSFKRRRKTALLDIQQQMIMQDKHQLTEAKSLEFRLARNQLIAGLSSLKAQSDNLTLAREVTDKLVLQYREGVTPLSDLLNAQTAQAEAETNYWQQVYNYKLSVLQLLKSIGQLDDLLK